MNRRAKSRRQSRRRARIMATGLFCGVYLHALRYYEILAVLACLHVEDLHCIAHVDALLIAPNFCRQHHLDVPCRRLRRLRRLRLARPSRPRPSPCPSRRLCG